MNDDVTMFCTRFICEETEMSIPLVGKIVSGLGLQMLTVGALILISGNSVVDAHGDHPRSELIFERVIDPYRIKVFVIPWVGDVHFSAYIAASDTGTPVVDADVKFTIFGSNDDRDGFSADPIFGSPGWYSATVMVEQENNLSVAVSVSGIGQIGERFNVSIRTPESGTSWGMVGLIMVGVILILRIFLNKIFKNKSPQRLNSVESPNS